jgi:4-amino-4-deoxy-L-arabinose transferase-like glycosyltransferase
MTGSSSYKLNSAASVVLAIAFFLRLGWAILIPVVPVSDSTAYDIFAQTLAVHGVYGWAPDQPSAYWPVGTSAIYAALYAVFGHSYIPVVVLNVALSAGIVGLTMRLGRIFFDDATAILAGGLMAIWPSQVAYVTILASELPFTFLLLLGFATWFSPRLSNSVRAIVGGLAFGAASYFRPIALLLPVILWLSMIPSWQKLREQLPMLILAMIVLGVSITPWSVRNTRLFGHFVMMSTNGGANFWMGNNRFSDGFYTPEPTLTTGLNEYEQDKVLGGEAMQYIIAEPVAFVLRTIKKAVLLQVGETIAIHWNEGGIKHHFGERALLPLKILTQGFWTGVLLLAFAGLIVMVRERGVTLTLMHPVVLTWIYFTAVHAITVVQDRYHFPYDPFISLLAAIAVLAAMRRSQQGPIRLPA